MDVELDPMSTPETDELVKRLEDWALPHSPATVKIVCKEAADRIAALESVLRAGADIVSGTWDGIYGLEEELTWVREVESLLKSQPSDSIGNDKSEYGHEG
jgi:hypothetical protein